MTDSQLVKPIVGPWVPSSEQLTTCVRMSSKISEQSCSFCELERDSRAIPYVLWGLVGGPVGSSLASVFWSIFDSDTPIINSVHVGAVFKKYLVIPSIMLSMWGQLNKLCTRLSYISRLSSCKHVLHHWSSNTPACTPAQCKPCS